MNNKRAKGIRMKVFEDMKYDKSVSYEMARSLKAFKKIYRAAKRNYTRHVTPTVQ